MRGTNGSMSEEASILCFNISPYHCNAMRSPNPFSGIYIADTARALDNNGGNPACNQGGIIILERSIDERK